jgi:hypothetical protein
LNLIINMNFLHESNMIVNSLRAGRRLMTTRF